MPAAVRPDLPAAPGGTDAAPRASPGRLRLPGPATSARPHYPEVPERRHDGQPLRPSATDALLEKILAALTGDQPEPKGWQNISTWAWSDRQ